MNSEKATIEVKDLQVSYDKSIVIPKMDVSLPKGKITMIIGSNGCGKSTLLKTISRIIHPDKGAVFIKGADIKKMAPKEVAKKMAVLPQSPVIPSGLLVKELVSYGRFPYQTPMGGMKEHDLKIVKWAMESTGIADLSHRFVDSLSGGQRQRAWIAMALAQETEILVLDEPTTYLDMSHQLEILQLLQNLNKKNHTTIVMVIHELNQAAKFADHVIGMKDGKIIFQGPPKEVITKDNLKKVYEIEAKLQMNEANTFPICIEYDLLKTNG